MNYFSGCTDLKSARKVYIELVKKHHPDKGGSQAIMQDINNQFDSFKKHGKATETMYGGARQGGRSHASDAFRYAYGFDWGAFDFESMRTSFYESRYRSSSTKARGKQAGPKEAKFAKEHKGEWSEEYESEANKKQREDTEDLRRRMEKLKEDIENKKYQLLADRLNRIINIKLETRQYTRSMFSNDVTVLTVEDIKEVLK